MRFGLTGLGDASLSIGNGEAAAAKYKAAFELRKAGRAAPGTGGAQAADERLLAASLIKLGDLAVSTARDDEALHSYNKALQILSRTDDEKENVGATPSIYTLVDLHDKIGQIHLRQGRVEMKSIEDIIAAEGSAAEEMRFAMQHFRRVKALVDAAKRTDPGNLQLDYLLAKLWSRLGQSYEAEGDTLQSQHFFRLALDDAQALNRRDAHNVNYRALAVKSCARLSYATSEKSCLDESKSELELLASSGFLAQSAAMELKSLVARAEQPTRVLGNRQVAPPLPRR